MAVTATQNPLSGLPRRLVQDGIVSEEALIQALSELDGRSLMPLLNDPSAEWDHPAFTVWSEDGRTLTGIVVRTPRWRAFTQYLPRNFIGIRPGHAHDANSASTRGCGDRGDCIRHTRKLRTGGEAVTSRFLSQCFE